MAILRPPRKARLRWALRVCIPLFVLALLIGAPALHSTRSTLVNSDTFVLYSLSPSYDPAHPNSPKYFYNSRIIGQTTITNSRLKTQLVDSLYKALKPLDYPSAACLFPHYAIHATKGWRTIDVIICFDCGNVVFHQYGKDGDTIPMGDTRSTRALYNQVLQRAGVPQTKQP